jgi:KAP family P-loop domain
LDGPTVLLLDGHWGTGKTTFVKMWLGELAKIGIPTIYFDAFANDYHEDAFLTIAGEIVARAEELKPRSKRALKKFRDTAIDVAKVLGRASVRIGIRTASAGLLTGEEVIEGVKIAADAAKAAGDETAKAMDELLKERLEGHKADRQVFDQFKTALGDLTSGLSAVTDEAKSTTARVDGAEGRAAQLVFVIDELDRCRPSFALEILEKIKHFFAVRGLIFVVVSSLGQLKTAVRSAYGDVDALTYLEKFYHLRILFPGDRRDSPDMAPETYLRYLQKEYSTGSLNVNSVIARFCRVRPLSLRTLERIFAYARIAKVSMPLNSFNRPEILSILCVIKVINPDLYEAARTGNLSFTQLDGLLQVGRWRDQHDPEKRDQVGEHVENWWRFALGELGNEELVSQYKRGLSPYGNSDPSGIIPYFCDIIDGLSFPQRDYEFDERSA